MLRKKREKQEESKRPKKESMPVELRGKRVERDRTTVERKSDKAHSSRSKKRRWRESVCRAGWQTEESERKKKNE